MVMMKCGGYVPRRKRQQAQVFGSKIPTFRWAVAIRDIWPLRLPDWADAVSLAFRHAAPAIPRVVRALCFPTCYIQYDIANPSNITILLQGATGQELGIGRQQARDARTVV